MMNYTASLRNRLWFIYCTTNICAGPSGCAI